MTHLPVTRCSALATLASCPGLFYAQGEGQMGGQSRAAHTGSAVGRAIELAHAGALLDDALRTVAAEAPEKWASADLEQVQRWAFAYCADPRNGKDSPYGVVVPGSCEREVEALLPPAPGDAGPPFRLVGHLDQLRRDRQGRLRVWDLKSGKPGGQELVLQYAWQLAAYALASTATVGEDVLPGGIIRLRGYDKVPFMDPCARDRALECAVFYEVHWSLEECKTMLLTAAAELGRVRAGYIHLRPGIHCLYCPVGGPVQGPAGCGDRLPDFVAQAAVGTAPLPEVEWGEFA